jgi:hypothetical protein
MCIYLTQYILHIKDLHHIQGMELKKMRTVTGEINSDETK